MEKGARHRNNTGKNHPGGSESEASPESSAGGGVALKKEIGLVSACGIIVGESNSFPHRPLLPVWRSSRRTLTPHSPNPRKALFLLPAPLEKSSFTCAVTYSHWSSLRYRKCCMSYISSSKPGWEVLSSVHGMEQIGAHIWLMVIVAWELVENIGLRAPHLRVLIQLT